MSDDLLQIDHPLKLEERIMKSLNWHDIHDVPDGMPVDVLYINETFDPAACGILYDAKACPDHKFFVSDEGAMVPAIYCVGWRQARHAEAEPGNVAERFGSIAMVG